MGVGLGATSYESADPAEVAPDEVALPRTNGIRVSYARRLKGDSKLWFGPEAVLVLIPKASLTTTRPDYPEAVSRTYVGSLLKLHVYPGAGEGWFGNVGLGFGAGLAYGRFAESGRLASGATATNPIVDGVFGPVVHFGVDYRVTTRVIVRGDAYLFLFEPTLSFPWPERIDDKAVAGIGLVVTF